MTEPHFNLIVDPWLRLATPDVTVTEASIETALRNSRDYTGLSGDFAPEDAAVTRVLLAIIYRAYKDEVPDVDDLDAVIDFWESLFHAPSLWTPQVEDYLNEHKERFSLSGDAPFMLTPELNEEGKDIFKLTDVITYVGVDQFSVSDKDTLTPAEVARAVICAQSYDTTGVKTGVSSDPRFDKGKTYGAKLTAASWGAVTVVTGSSLHETLVLNYVPYLTRDGDLPPWEKHHPGVLPFDPLVKGERGKMVEQSVAPKGPVESMTWQSRRINIRWTEDGNADAAVICSGDSLDANALYGAESMSPFYFSEAKSEELKSATYRVEALKPDREAWSKLGGFLPEATPRTHQGDKKRWHGNRSTMPAENIKWVKTLVNEGILHSTAHLRAHAVSVVYGPNNSLPIDVIQAGFPVPKSAMENDAINDAIFAAVNALPSVMGHISVFYKSLVLSPMSGPDMAYGDGGKADKRAVSNVFEAWLDQIGEYNGDADQAYRTWAEKTLRTVEAYADRTISTLPTRAFVSTVSDGKHIEHPMKARSALRYKVEKALGLRKEDHDQGND